MARSPWFITAHAVCQYLRAVGRPVVDEGPEFSLARAELTRMAIATMAADRVPKQLRAQRMFQYRGPKPLRLRFIVSTTIRPEGPRPQLVDVLSAWGDRLRGPKRFEQK